MKQYLNLLSHILENGVLKSDRTGTGTKSVFGHQMRFDLTQGFPLVTTKKLHLKSIIHELLWFLSGDTNIKYLTDNGVTIWNEWKRPYTFNREIIQVDRIYKDYVPYDGDFSWDRNRDVLSDIDEKLANMWRKMMERCYDKSAHNYKFYGAKGTSVCKRWHSTSNFIEDVKLLPHWDYKLSDWNNFNLDKDYYGSNHYSPETCVWLSKSENNSIKTNCYYIKIPNHETYYFLNVNETIKKIGMSHSTFYRFLNDGLPKTLKGNNKKFESVEIGIVSNETNKLLRHKLIQKGDLGKVYGHQWRSWECPNGETIDQISQVIDQIKNNPDSRRLIVSAWNVADVDEMALPPCHMMFQFYVANGELSCQLYQRSADVFLGVPFNIASYALLTEMIAQQCNLKAKEFVWTGGDCHLYSNHFEQAQLQLSREPLELPKLNIKRRPADIFSYTYDDFEILNYQSHSAIKAQVSV